MLGGMLVHLRLTVPTDLSDEARELLMDHDHVTNAGRRQPGAGDRHRHLDEIWGSLSQLGLNLTGMFVAGTITLALQRLTWHRLTANAERLFALVVRKPGDRYDGATRYP